MCNITHDIYSDKSSNDYMNVNEAAVLRCIAIGNGFFQMVESHAALNLPSMNNHKYVSVSADIAEVIINTAWKCMKETGEEDARYFYIAEQTENFVVDNAVLPKIQNSNNSLEPAEYENDLLSSEVSVFSTEPVISKNYNNEAVYVYEVVGDQVLHLNTLKSLNNELCSTSSNNVIENSNYSLYYFPPEENIICDLKSTPDTEMIIQEVTKTQCNNAVNEIVTEEVTNQQCNNLISL
ncbi:hypothetical protein FQR65_LT09650 [Abscondita terminalis]|nr:hypothetical protein FQR65_LT09650 [Abscondita terminalis]